MRILPYRTGFQSTLPQRERPDIKGATASAAGTRGLVPAPAKGMQNAFLKGDGTWMEFTEITDAEIDAIIAGTFK